MRGEKLRANLPLFMGRTDRRGKFARWQKKRFSLIDPHPNPNPYPEHDPDPDPNPNPKPKTKTDIETDPVPINQSNYQS
jgi:hypothetical protein